LDLEDGDTGRVPLSSFYGHIEAKYSKG